MHFIYYLVLQKTKLSFGDFTTQKSVWITECSDNRDLDNQGPTVSQP